MDPVIPSSDVSLFLALRRRFVGELHRGTPSSVVSVLFFAPPTSPHSSECARQLLEGGAAIIIVKKYNHDLRETLQLAGAEAV